MKKLIALASLFCLLAFSVSAHSEFDVAPDGKTASLLGKYNRVLYFIDIEKSEVQKRIKLEVQSMGSSEAIVAYSQDGSKLWCSLYNELFCYETVGWTEVFHLEKAYNVVVSEDKTKIMYRYNTEDSFEVKDMSSLAEYSKIEVKESRKVSMMSISSIDNSVLLVYRSEKDDSEPSSISKDELKALVGAKKATAYQKNDGEKARIVKLNLSTGAILFDEYSWFSDNGRGGLFSNEGNYYMLGYKGSFVFDTKNKLTVLELESQVSMNYKKPFSDMVVIGFYNLKGFYNIPKEKFTELKYDRDLEENQAIYMKDRIYSFNNFEFNIFDAKGVKTSSMKVL